MTGFLRMLLAVGVIVGWLLVLTWLAVSVTQIAVTHTVIAPCAVASPGGPAC